MNRELSVRHTVSTELLCAGQHAAGALRFGLDGKSAYRAALEGGFEGTEEEFNRMLAAAARTYLIDLTHADYPAVVRQAMDDLRRGRPVELYLRAESDAPARPLADVRDAGAAYAFTEARTEASEAEGVATLTHTEYFADKTTGQITRRQTPMLDGLLTTRAVQDDLAGEACDLPVSQRQALFIRRALDILDAEALRRSDTLLLDGNGATEQS